MILRVWAMYNRSKVVLGILLTIYIMTNALYCVTVILYDIPGVPGNITGIQSLTHLLYTILTLQHSEYDSSARFLVLRSKTFLAHFECYFTHFSAHLWRGNVHLGDRPIHNGV